MKYHEIFLIISNLPTQTLIIFPRRGFTKLSATLVIHYTIDEPISDKKASIMFSNEIESLLKTTL